jgi:hypothetical protein
LNLSIANASGVVTCILGVDVDFEAERFHCELVKFLHGYPSSKKQN